MREIRKAKHFWFPRLGRWLLLQNPKSCESTSGRSSGREIWEAWPGEFSASGSSFGYITKRDFKITREITGLINCNWSL